MAVESIKGVVRRMPGVVTLYRALLALIPRRIIFARIYARNTWAGKDSVSGPGSNAEQTKAVVAQLPRLLDNFQVHKVLDIPCGDFHWMRDVDLQRIDYTGADIVRELIEKNAERYESESIRFCSLDLIKDHLPPVDLILCRDCLVHLSFKDIWSALHNVLNSGSTYLLATTFTRRTENQNIVTGHWRRLNLQVAPFLFPPPLAILNEQCTEGGGENDDKSLGLWRIADIAEHLPKHRLAAPR
jgi:hypothetical protein